MLISYEQMNNFVANMLEIKNREEKSLLALSQTAYQHLSVTQKSRLQQYVKLVPLAIPTIEKIGGGSVRCMIAENFLTPKEEQQKEPELK